MGRRILAFFLGFIFAFVCIAGAICIVVFAIKIDQMAPVTDKYIGDLAHMSIYDVGQSLYSLYLDKKAWQDENGKYYSLEDFCKNYNIDLNAAFGIELPQEVLDIPAFEYFNDGGVDNALKQIKVSTLPAIVNMFGGKNEDGASNGMFGDDVIAELANYSMSDLLSEEKGLGVVFANISFAQILPTAFPAEDSDNKLMWAVGQTKIGGMINGIGGSESILLQLREGGAFETLGGLQLSAVLGDSQYINAILGSGAVFADLIADDGSIRLDDIINGVSIGELLGCQKNEITALDGYAAIDGQSADAEKQVMQKVVGEGSTAVALYVMSVNGEHWYEAELKCDLEEKHVHNDECYKLDCDDASEEHVHNEDCYKLDCDKATDGHVHNADCYKFVWYSTTQCTKSHDHAANGDMNKDGVNYARTDGLYAILAALSITDFTSGNTDVLMNEIKKVKISDIIDSSAVSGPMKALIELTIEELMNGAIDDMYLGEFFSFDRVAIQNIEEYGEAFRVNKERDNEVLAYYVRTKEDSIAISYNQKNWYAGKMDCDKADEDGHVHTENCYSYLWYRAENVLAEGVQNKLASKQIADLRYLNDEVRSMTLADVFGSDNVPTMLKSIADVKIGELSEHIDTIQLGTLLGYTGVLNCDNDEEDHTHDHSCYVWTDKNGNAVDGMMAKLAYKTVGEIGDLANTIKTFTMRDVLGNDIPDMLKSLADVEIGDLNRAINDMYLGDFLEYVKRDKECTIDHEHSDKCTFDWYELKCNENHEHGDECYALVEGMMAKLAYNKVSELGSLQNTIQDFTLRDVLGDNIPAMLLDVADKPICEVGDAIQDIYLGSALGYNRKAVAETDAYVDEIVGSTTQGRFPVIRKTRQGLSSKYIESTDGKTWYEVTLTCKNKDASHDHNGDCFDYVWYEDEACETPVSGIVKALVNTKVKDVGSKVDTMTLGEMGIGEGNKILEALQDTPINQIGDEINNLKMAVVLGYEKYYTCGETHKTHEETCTYVWIMECSSDHSGSTDHLTSDHILIGTGDNQKTYYPAKGLNAKIADKTVREMTGDELTNIAMSLTIGDLIDSGLIELGQGAEKTQNEYKLSLIFSDGSHSFTENTRNYKCNYVDYAIYTKIPGNDNSTKIYWDKCHAGIAEEDLKDHTNAWKNLTLREFVTTLLSVL